MIVMAYDNREFPEAVREYKPADVERTYIEMRDGIQLYAEVFRPNSPGPFPTILSRNPYHSSDIPPHTRDKNAHRDYVSHGYAVVEAEVRGTGISEGRFLFLKNDGNDGCDTIEWILEQPWCDGNVGMMGLSYLSMDQFAVAGQNPPGLKAFFAGVGGADIYGDMVYPGGIFATLAMNWAQRHIGRLISNHVPLLRNVSGIVDPRIYPMQEKVHGDRTRVGYEHLLGGKLFDTTYVTDWIEHPTDGEYWREMSPYRFFPDIKVPIYCFGGWFDLFPGGVIRSFQEIDAPKKLLMGPWFHGQSDGIDLTGEKLRWFDYWLKGEDTGIMDDPPVLYYLMGRGEWKAADGWPPRTRDVRYFLRSGTGVAEHSLNDGLLTTDPPDEDVDPIEHDPDDPIPSIAFRNADISRGERRMLTYTTNPLEEEIEVVGSIRINLATSTGARDVDWTVKLSEVLPEGESIILCSSALKGSHHLSHESPEDLVPGNIYDMKITLSPTCNAFGVGNRIRISIGNSDFPLLAPNPIPSENLLHHKGSFVSLPVAN
jgi:putative CocE/NonD family hydrolase